MKWYISIPKGKSNFLKVHVLHDSAKYFSGTRVNEIVKIVSSLQFVIYRPVKNCCSTEKWMLLEIVDKFLNLCYCQIIWYLIVGFKTIILCSVHSLWFVKYMFSAKIWFMKTSTRIVKYKSQVIKSNPAYNRNIYKQRHSSIWWAMLLMI